MNRELLFFAHYALLLIFGVILSAAFCGISHTKENGIRLGLLTVFCGGLQAALYGFLGEQTVWLWYPVITHIPMLIFFWRVFGKHFPVCVSAVASAYLCCQPAKWMGLTVLAFGGDPSAELLVRILVLLATLLLVLRWFSGKIAGIYGGNRKSAWVFGIIPVVYYLFDYTVSIYSSLWTDHSRLVAEFLPFFLCVGHLLFCSVYYREYEMKNEAEQKEQLMRLLLEQQAREVETIRRSESEIRLLRHDLRFFLNSLSACIENGDRETARKMISGFSDRAEASAIKRYCCSDTLNYVLSDYAARCREKGVVFCPDIRLEELAVDEILFSTVLANALDNALNAQEGLPSDRRIIRLLLKNSGGKLLLSVRNTFREQPVFLDGLPVATREGHGSGVRSILYITEKLGGNCRFFLEDDRFVLQVVL